MFPCEALPEGSPPRKRSDPALCGAVSFRAVFDGGIEEDAISEETSEIKAVRGVVVRPITITPGQAKSGQCHI